MACCCASDSLCAHQRRGDALLYSCCPCPSCCCCCCCCACCPRSRLSSAASWRFTASTRAALPKLHVRRGGRGGGRGVNAGGADGLGWLAGRQPPRRTPLEGKHPESVRSHLVGGPHSGRARHSSCPGERGSSASFHTIEKRGRLPAAAAGASGVCVCARGPAPPAPALAAQALATLSSPTHPHT